MYLHRRAHCLALLGAAASFFHISVMEESAQASVDVLSYHGGDTTSTGLNSHELQITPSSINSVNFGRQFTTSITDVPNITGMPASAFASGINYTAPAGQVYAEPLVKAGVNIKIGNHQGLHDVVFVATSMDSLFAIDANGGTILWKDSFIYNASGNPNPAVNAAIPAGVTAAPGGTGTEIISGDLNPWVGIVGTPVIDGVNGYIYLVAKTREVHGGDQGHPHYVQTLHKVALQDGTDTNTVIADTTLQTSDTTYTYNSGPFVLGNGNGSITVSGESRIYFNAVRQMVRPALELFNGRVYIASGSHGDNQPYHGWILTYDANMLACNGAWNATPTSGQGEAGIWQGGGGVVIDPANGYIYFETGNGSFDGQISNGVVTGLDANGFPILGNYGDCFVKLALDPTTTQDNQGTNKNGWGLKIVDYFSPYNNTALDNVDEDVGSAGPTLLPDAAGSTAHPHLLIGGGKEGKLYLIDRDNMGKFGITDNVVQTVGGVLNGILSVPAYFNGRLYATSGYGGTSVSWQLTNAALSGLQQSPDQINYAGCSAFITANGTTDGVVWELDKNTGELRAYDALNMASEIWTSNQNANQDALGSAVKFACPTPVNGHVYVGTADHLVAYGSSSVETSAPAAPTGLTVSDIELSTVTLTWTDNSDNENGFRIERSSDNVNFTEVATVGVNQTTFEDSGLSTQATYYYRVRAANSFNGTSYSAYSNVVSATTLSQGSITPVYLYHFDEGSGNSTADSVGGNNGTLIGATKPAWETPGRIGNADLRFTGNGQANQANGCAVQVPTDLSSVLGGTCSLLFWIKIPEGQVGNDTHQMAPAVTGVDHATDGNDINWGYIDNGGHIGVAVGDSGSVFSVNPINDNTWHFIAMSRDAATGVVNIYVDGAFSATATFEAGTKTTPFYLIGALSDVAADGVTVTGTNNLNGSLDDVGIYNKVVDATTVAKLGLPPAAATNLVVTAASGTELDLSWTDNADNETGYEIWRSINGAAFTRLAQLLQNTTTYMDVGLNQGTPYSYFVRAINSVGSTDSVTVNTATPSPPTTPSGTTITYLSPTEIDLQWIDNATTETGYNVLRRTGTADFAQLAQLPPNSTGYHDTSAQPGISYDYHIEAFNVAGYSDFAGITVTTPTTPQMQTYLSSYFTTSQMANSAISGPMADPDHDGIPNLLEYAFNLNPTKDSVSGLPTVQQLNGYLAVTFVQPIAPDVRYTVEVSSDLSTWNTSTTVVSTTAIDSATQRVTVRDNTPFNAQPCRFIRVQVTY